MIRSTLKRILSYAGLQRAPNIQAADPVEFLKEDLEVLEFVLANNLTLVSRQRLIATIKSCKHAVEAGIEGDFVECGVWRGGNSIAAKLTLENYGSRKKVWLFDTFAGMTEPAEFDTSSFSTKTAQDQYREAQNEEHNEWRFASIDDVRANFQKSGVDLSGVRMVAGDVRKTLCDQDQLPDAISVLRLDTDFYDSTKIELEALYPRLSTGGSLLIDDFGHWDGARRAVEEYFNELQPRSRPLLYFTDYTGRMAVKVM